MFKNTLVKAVFVLMCVSMVAINTGCLSSVAGPETPSASTTPTEESESVSFKSINADLDQDGDIDPKDLEWFEATLTCDMNHDQVVDEVDGELVLAAMGKTTTISDWVLFVSVTTAREGYLPIVEVADVDGNGLLNSADYNKIKKEVQRLSPS